MKNVIAGCKIIFLLALLFTGKSNQAQYVFQKQYLGSDSSIGYSIVSESDGLVIAGTTSLAGQGGLDVLMMKTDLNGNILWAKSIGGSGNEVARAIRKTSDGGYILAGSTSSYVYAASDSSNFYIIKTDQSGTIQWTRAIGLNNTEVANDVIETYDHKYVIVGYSTSMGAGNKDVFLVELDSVGNLQWAYGMGSSGADIGHSVVQTASHGFFIVGSTTGFNAGGQIPYLIPVSETGVVQNPSYTYNLNTPMSTTKKYFTKIINGYLNDYVITGSDGQESFGAAHHFILNIGQNGEVIWMKKYILNSGEGVGTSLDKTNDGGFILGGTMGFDHPAMIKVDATGQLEATMFYPDLSSPYLGKGLDIKQTSDGLYALVGYRYNALNTAVYLVKADLNLSSGCDEHTGFINTAADMNPTLDLRTTASATGSVYIAIDSGVVAAVAPVMDVICISTGIDQNPGIRESLEIHQSDISVMFVLNDANDLITSVSVFNLLGEKIFSSARDKQTVTTAGFSRGIYIYRVSTENQQLYSGKFIIR